ncbi:hypothetical protein AWB69_00129 [Caballeronia udeis]|uniref:Uncharacterized protein n=1 Tax=Caballeronia udeis TaxID=1232866 RepID=A0A158ERD6_9BURK|nr:hypothetical protein AWB69_00129 [Caballeronia udeis]
MKTAVESPAFYFGSPLLAVANAFQSFNRKQFSISRHRHDNEVTAMTRFQTFTLRSLRPLSFADAG